MRVPNLIKGEKRKTENKDQWLILERILACGLDSEVALVTARATWGLYGVELPIKIITMAFVAELMKQLAGRHKASRFP